jgi:schlafen family protein
MADSVRASFAAFASEDDLRAGVAQRREEGLYLEFKQKHDRSKAALDDEDRINFSKTVSAFANADGGVLIFGVSTRKAGRGHPDHADKLKPITDPHAFLGRLQDSVLNTTDPPVDDIEFHVIESVSEPGAGYMVCFIPASDRTPHRAVLADREYYRRTASGVRRLDHIDLEDMFGRRPHPKLVAILELRLRPGDDPHEELHVHFLNEGRAIARYTGALGTVLDPSAVIAGGRGEITDVSALNQGRPMFQFIDNISAVHPNGIARSAGHAILRRPRKGSGLEVRLRWYCEGMQWREEVADLPPGIQVSLS